MSGKEMMLGSVKDAVAFGANTFMLYTGAPQNTRRKDISELRIQEAHELMAQNGIEEFVVACAVYNQSCKYSKSCDL